MPGNDSVYIPYCPLITVDRVIQNRVSHRKKVMLKITNGSPCPYVALFLRRYRHTEEVKDPLYIYIKETEFNPKAPKHARQPRNARRRFAWLCNGWVNKDDQSSDSVEFIIEGRRF
jgi:hypothetical protein